MVKLYEWILVLIRLSHLFQNKLKKYIDILLLYRLIYDHLKLDLYFDSQCTNFHPVPPSI